MFDLQAWASEEKPTSYTYTIVGVSPNALKVLRNDRVSPQTFSKKTFQAKLKEGSLTILSPNSFQLNLDPEWNPDSQFDDLDLG